MPARRPRWSYLLLQATHMVVKISATARDTIQRGDLDHRTGHPHPGPTGANEQREHQPGDAEDRRAERQPRKGCRADLQPCELTDFNELDCAAPGEIGYLAGREADPEGRPVL